MIGTAKSEHLHLEMDRFVPLLDLQLIGISHFTEIKLKVSSLLKNNVSSSKFSCLNDLEIVFPPIQSYISFQENANQTVKVKSFRKPEKVV